MNLVKKIGLLLFIIFIMAQFFGPKKNEGNLTSIKPFYTETNPSAEVKQVLEVACFDCHSNVTKYPWYNNITPVNYWLASHVNDGKKHLNISNWEGNSLKRKDHKFEELIEMVEAKEMPLNSYTWVHSEAKLTDAQRKLVIDWAKNVRIMYALIPQPE